MSVPDHYMTLEIECNASDEDIKQAFRRLAKKFHPDKNPGKEKVAERRFKQITAAYEILSNRRARNTYDRLLKASRASVRDSRRENLRRRAKENVVYLCQLMLFELLNQNAQSALEIYEELKSKNPHFSLEPYMSYGDTRDCEFLLGEAYHQRGRLSEAARLYERALEQEKRKAYFRGFAQEIEIMLKDVYLQRIAKAERSEEIAVNISKVLTLNISSREIARIHKKAAESYFKMGDVGRAREALQRAFEVNPKLTGAKRISRELGMKNGMPEASS
jgi:curved DNA-binding protein CbpA